MRTQKNVGSIQMVVTLGVFLLSLGILFFTMPELSTNLKSSTLSQNAIEIPLPTLSLEVIGNGQILEAGQNGAVFNLGEEISLHANETDPNFKFDKWELQSVGQPTEGFPMGQQIVDIVRDLIVKFKMDSNVKAIAHFLDKRISRKLTFFSSPQSVELVGDLNTTVKSGDIFENGTKVHLKARILSPNEDLDKFHIYSWQDGKVLSSEYVHSIKDDNGYYPITIVMDSDKEVSAGLRNISDYVIYSYDVNAHVGVFRVENGVIFPLENDGHKFPKNSTFTRRLIIDDDYYLKPASEGMGIDGPLIDIGRGYSGYVGQGAMEAPINLGELNRHDSFVAFLKPTLSVKTDTGTGSGRFRISYTGPSQDKYGGPLASLSKKYIGMFDIEATPDEGSDLVKSTVTEKCSNGLSGPAYSGQSTHISGEIIYCDVTVDIIFDKITTPKYNLATRFTGSGTGTFTVQPNTTPIDAGTPVTITVAPTGNSFFNGFSFEGSSGCVAINGMTCMFVMNSDKTIVMDFSQGINGTCGTDINLCVAGDPVDTPDSTAQYLWSCNGVNGGTTSPCALNKPINGVCGNAATTYASTVLNYGTNVQCSPGTSNNTAFPAIGASVTWTCAGEYGGTTSTTCTASRSGASINGTCGGTNNTCTAGTTIDTPDSTAQYLWSCNGVNGGNNASCSIDKPSRAAPAVPVIIPKSGIVIGSPDVLYVTTASSVGFQVACTPGDIINVYNGMYLLTTKTCGSISPETVGIPVPATDGILSVTTTLTDWAHAESARSPIITVINDQTSRSSPGIPDMLENTDTGLSNTDNITANTQPQFSVTCQGGNAVQIYENTTFIGGGTCMMGTALITPSQKLLDGVHALTAKQTHPITKVTSISSEKLNVTIDTLAPTKPASIAYSGSMPGAGVTLTWSGSSGIEYAIYRDGALVETGIRGTQFTDSGTLAEGKRYTYRVRAYDMAGNFSETTSLYTKKTIYYALTTRISGTGSGDFSLSDPSLDKRKILAGTKLSISAKPKAGSTFTGFRGCDVVRGNTCEITMSTNKQVIMSFSTVPRR